MKIWEQIRAKVGVKTRRSSSFHSQPLVWWPDLIKCKEQIVNGTHTRIHTIQSVPKLISEKAWM